MSTPTDEDWIDEDILGPSTFAVFSEWAEAADEAAYADL
jgi:hypothetical protein